MGFYNSPRIITDDLIFSIDAANIKSWSGELPGTGTPYGYWAGGFIPGRTFIDRLDFSNDTATAVAKGNLVQERYAAMACNNISYGYIAGGGGPSPVRSSIDRTEYSNDTATAVAKGPLSEPRYGGAAASNASYDTLLVVLVLHQQ